MSGKVIDLPKKENSPDKSSREAFLKELVGEDAESQWSNGAEANEVWALSRQAKELAVSSLLDQRDEAKAIDENLKSKGFTSRRLKIAQLKEQRKAAKAVFTWEIKRN